MTLRNWLSGIRSKFIGKSRATRRSQQPKRIASAAEVLEIRQVPTTAVLQVGVLTITGGDQADNIFVTKSGANLRVSGVTTRFAASKVTSIVVNAGGGDDTVDLSPVAVATRVYGGAGNDVLIGGSGKDVLKGEAGNDVLRGNGGNDVLDGGADLDVIRESANANFVLTNAQLTGVGTDTLVNIETASLQGGAGNNRLNATQFSGSVTLDGTAGNDTLIGGALADSLLGGVGNDSLVGNAGMDTLVGGANDDVLVGGSDSEIDVFVDAGGKTRILNRPATKTGEPAVFVSSNPENQKPSLGFDKDRLIAMVQNSTDGFGTLLKQAQKDSLRQLITFIENDTSIQDIRWIAYMLATAKWETGHTYAPVSEVGGTSKPYAPFYGRGYVQITWRETYEDMGRKLGIDLVKHPELANQAETAYRIFSLGMRSGFFNNINGGGRERQWWGMEKYLNDTQTVFDGKTPYQAAREMVNFYDSTTYSTIAGYAQKFENMLRATALRGDGETDGDTESDTDVPMTEILNAYNTGRVNFQNVAQSIVDNGLGQNLPVVQESVGTVLDVVSKLRTVFDNALSGTQEQVATAVKALESLGFHLEYVGSQADANGDLLRISYDRSITDRAGFNFSLTGGESGFSYFDNDVNVSNDNNQLSGRFNAQSPTVNVHVTFGVDLVGNTPTFYVAESSNVSFAGLNGSVGVSGEMAIRYLADVKADGTLTVDLDGRLGLRDSDRDQKLRLSDFSNTASIVGDVDGSIVLNVDMNTNLPVLRNMTWHGDWRADVVDGRVNVGSPTLRTPSVEDVTAALLNSFVDMKNSFSFLGPIRDVINTKLDVLDKSIGELTGVGRELGWLNGSVSAAKEQLRSLGITIPDVTLDTITSLINGQRVNLIEWHDGASGTLLSEHGSFLLAGAVLPGTPFVVTVSGTVDAELGWEWEAGFGVDTTGVWIDPRTHIGLYGGVRAGIEASVTIAGLFGLNFGAGAGAQVFAGIGLRDPDASDGRIYMDEIFRGVGDSRSLGQAIIDVMKIDTRLEVEGYARAEIDLPWPLPDITLFDTSFKLGDIASQHQEVQQTTSLRRIPLAGQGERALPATLRADGTLLITGTADRDYVGLKGRDGTVDVKWSGYRNGHFTGVNKVLFNGGDEADSLTVDETFNIPIEANGGAGDDLLTGGSANDTLNGGAGNDDLQGRAGNDFIDAGEGNDNVDGGADNDQINGGSGRDVLQGGAGHDRINGQDGQDAVEGGAGNDTLSGGNDFDAIYGGSGDDVLDGDAGNDNLAGEEGQDILRGGLGRDVLRGGIGDDQLSGGADDDLMFGDEGQDVLDGDDGADILLGGTDNDRINGGKGNDLVRGEAGDDELHGSLLSDNVVDADDVDTLQGGEGTDTLRGGRGSDYLNGDEGQDDVNGEAGEDVIIIDLSTSVGSIKDLVAGGVDRDTLWISPAYAQSDDIESAAQDGLSAALDQATSNAGQQEFDPNALGQLVVAAYQRGTGDNELHLTQLDVDDFKVEQFDPVTHQLVASMTFTLSGGAQSDLETITMAGLDGNDTLIVSANTTRDIVLDGGDGNDTLQGGSGRDILRGQAGNDSLLGYASNDELHGGIGNDTLAGGDGTDRLYGESDDDSMNGGAGHDYQVGGAGNDFIEAGSGDIGDVIDGGAGYDTLIGGDGVDVIRGGDESGPKVANDPNSLKGDFIDGRGMNDFLDGGHGDDTIIGGAGADIIIGGEGHDSLTAGASENETLRSPDAWRQEDLQVRDELARLNVEILALTREVELLRAIPVDQRTDDENAQLAEKAQAELNLRTEEDQLSDVRGELNRERGAILVEELDKVGIHLDYQSLTQDIVLGDAGNDTIFGSAYQDFLVGGEGDDEFHHSTGKDAVIGGEGVHDRYVLQATAGNDVVTITAVQGESSNLAFLISINQPIEQGALIDLDPDVEGIGVYGLGGDDTMTANLGKNALKDVFFDGGDGNDNITVNGEAFLYDEQGHQLLDTDGQPIESKATLIGGAGNDTLKGGKSDDLLIGGLENGTGIGTDNDSLEGGEGRDTILGNEGNDILNGGAENDSLDGGSGTDLLNGDAGQDTLVGGRENDTLNGGSENDSLDGGSGDDSLDGGSGEDMLVGGADNDVLIGGTENDILDGGDGVDQLDGGAGNDMLRGGNDDDFLVDNSGTNTFFGGAGSDYVDDRRPENQFKDPEGIDWQTSRLVQQVAFGDGTYLLTQFGQLGLLKNNSVHLEVTNVREIRVGDSGKTSFYRDGNGMIYFCRTTDATWTLMFSSPMAAMVVGDRGRTGYFLDESGNLYSDYGDVNNGVRVQATNVAQILVSDSGGTTYYRTNNLQVWARTYADTQWCGFLGFQTTSQVAQMVSGDNGRNTYFLTQTGDLWSDLGRAVPIVKQATNVVQILVSDYGNTTYYRTLDGKVWGRTAADTQWCGPFGFETTSQVTQMVCGDNGRTTYFLTQSGDLWSDNGGAVPVAKQATDVAQIMVADYGNATFYRKNSGETFARQAADTQWNGPIGRVFYQMSVSSNGRTAYFREHLTGDLWSDGGRCDCQKVISGGRN